MRGSRSRVLVVAAAGDGGDGDDAGNGNDAGGAAAASGARSGAGGGGGGGFGDLSRLLAPLRMRLTLGRGTSKESAAAFLATWRFLFFSGPCCCAPAWGTFL